MSLLRVALPTPLRRLFDYKPVAGLPLPEPGVRVQVPFGSRQLVGIVIGLTDHSDVPANKLRAARDYLDQTPLLDAQTLGLMQWVAGYYHQPLGEVMQLALPALLRQGQALHPPQQPRWQLTPQGRTDQAAELSRAPRQAALLRHLQHLDRPVLQKELLAAGYALAQIQALESKALIEKMQLAPKSQGVGLPWMPATPAQPGQVLAEMPLKLTAEQAQALDDLMERLGRFAPVLLQGVTGSGKTEVYLQLIRKVLENRQQVLVLIPEIGLTPQTLSRFQQRFNRKVVALHSGLTDRERLDAWRASMEGQADILLGTRSAVFTPLPRLGLIIVDEEHDASFKQQDSVRYQARDVAIMRAKRQSVPVVLGSATPSLETLAHAKNKNYAWLKLKQRPTATALPPVPQLLDIRSRHLQGGFSEPLLQAMDRHLKQGNQVLVLLNRRGYAPVLMCVDCGWIAGCSHCDARMTWHREPAGLHCHHCDLHQPLPPQCPHCQSQELRPLGVGTERAEEVLQARFADIPILRIDRDTVRSRQSLLDKLEQIHHARPGILLGTQMLAKGHHFPAVTLATLLDADHGLYSSDPRAMERTAQLIIQVAGRSGRSDLGGEVIIQTHHSDDPRLLKLCLQGYEALALDLLQARQAEIWPPYAYLAIWRADALKAADAAALLEAIRQMAEQVVTELELSLELLGPAPAPMERRQGHYHMQLLLHAQKRDPIHRLIQALMPRIETLPQARKARWSLDVDPEDLF